jgi:hypothetical protein
MREIEVARDRDVQNGVAEEFEPLVRGRAVLGPVRVREDLFEP